MRLRTTLVSLLTLALPVALTPVLAAPAEAVPGFVLPSADDVVVLATDAQAGQVHLARATFGLGVGASEVATFPRGSAVAVAPDGSVVVYDPLAGTVTRYDDAPGTVPAVAFAGIAPASAVDASITVADDGTVYVASDSGSYRLDGSGAHTQLPEVVRATGTVPPSAIVAGPGGSLLGLFDGHLYRLASGAADWVEVTELVTGPVDALAVAADGTVYVAPTGTPGTVRSLLGVGTSDPSFGPDVVLGADSVRALAVDVSGRVVATVASDTAARAAAGQAPESVQLAPGAEGLGVWAPVPQVTAAGPPSAVRDTPFSYTFLAEYGPTVTGVPLTWALTAGSLPPGLSLDAATGTLSGTPTAYGTSTFTLRAGNGARGATVETSLTVPAPEFDDELDPSIDGSPVVGSVLQALAGSYVPSDATLSYVWRANGEPIPHAPDAASFTLTPAEQGSQISVTITARATDYADNVRTATAVGPVTGGAAASPAAGDLYFYDRTTNRIVRKDAAGGESIVVDGEGYSQPQTDGLGRVYLVHDVELDLGSYAQEIVRIDPSGPVVVAGPVERVDAFAVAQDGSVVYVALDSSITPWSDAAAGATETYPELDGFGIRSFSAPACVCAPFVLVDGSGALVLVLPGIGAFRPDLPIAFRQVVAGASGAIYLSTDHEVLSSDGVRAEGEPDLDIRSFAVDAAGAVYTVSDVNRSEVRVVRKYLTPTTFEQVRATVGTGLAISAPAPTIDPATPPGGSVGEPYSYTFTATTAAGTPPAIFSSAGPVPDGLTLSASGVLSGTPTVAGTFEFAVSASHAVFADETAPLTVVIAPGASTPPVGGEPLAVRVPEVVVPTGVRVGTPVTASLAAPVSPAAAVVTWQWLRAGEPIPGATGPTYTPVPADLGRVLTAVASGTAPGYVEASSRASTGPVLAGVLSGLAVVLPDTARVGVPVLAMVSAPTPTADLVYAWSVGGVARPGVTGPTYTPAASDLGKTITVQVGASRAGFDSATASDSVGPVAAAPTTPVVALTGRAVVGSTITASLGGVEKDAAVSWSWLAGDTVVGSATGPELPVRAWMWGRRLRAVATVAGTPAISAATPPVRMGRLVVDVVEEAVRRGGELQVVGSQLLPGASWTLSFASGRRLASGTAGRLGKLDEVVSLPTTIALGSDRIVVLRVAGIDDPARDTVTVRG
ncbi:MAG: hypothetical protein F2667_00575 [Actinobacteria bacterium]|uniref:Unannotated protein n=1 Tax=freshwater metagenome TaxID=449393 RepID=A0A6J6NG01_9ZZZZ|nr:hypothetical protein [Actinomycetota bacterium]